ncbi:MAG: hypothetical protein ACMG57_05960 [Candidatus Dojkabacteria bacterium]
MNQPAKQTNNTSFGQSSTEAYPEVKVTSLPPLPINKTKFRDYEEDDDDYEDNRKPKGKGCAPGCGCRSIACGGCIVIILLIIGAVFIAVNKPAGIWNSVVDFLNAGVQVPAFKGTTSDQAKSQINDQIKAVGENKVTIDEDAFTAILRERVPDLKNPSVDIEPGIIKIYWDLDQTVKDDPLHGVIEVKVQDKNLVITKAGVNRVGTPSFLNDFVSKTVINLFNQAGAHKDGDYSLLYNFLSPDKNITITNLSLEQDKAIITLNINANLF